MPHYTVEQVKQMMLELADPNVKIDISTYKNISTPCRFIDAVYGEWWVKPNAFFFRGYRHQARKYNKARAKHRVSIDEIKLRLSAAHQDRVKLDETTYVIADQKARFIDKDYGEWWATVSSVIRGGGHPERGKISRKRAMVLSIQEIERRIKIKHGATVSIDASTFKGTHQKARFIHIKYGEWWSRPTHVLRGSSHPKGHQERIRQTLRRKYGVDHALQREEFFRKTFRSHSKRVTVLHWKTQSPVICMASYEYAVVRKLNELKIDYDSQIRFQLSKSVYYCDLYIKDWDKYIELKGYFRPHSKKKWEEFMDAHPNAELWEADKVCEFTGKTKHHLGKDFRLAWESSQASTVVEAEATRSTAL